jgi:hypothetical protein
MRPRGAHKFVAELESRPRMKHLFVGVIRMASAYSGPSQTLDSLTQLEGDRDAGFSTHPRIDLALKTVRLRCRVAGNSRIAHAPPTRSLAAESLYNRLSRRPE